MSKNDRNRLSTTGWNLGQQEDRCHRAAGFHQTQGKQQIKLKRCSNARVVEN